MTLRNAQNGGQGYFDQEIAPSGDLYADLDIPPFCRRCKQCNGIGGVNLVSLPDRIVQLHPACEAAGWKRTNDAGGLRRSHDLRRPGRGRWGAPA